ncbi:CsbD family protein [Streptomyces sp. H27-H5]|uniref:CsbD family protein n=1 Tax=Streptomyces sp. H27-H5 TaxID=2996460 RepID=UPI00226FCDC3|nr:CsbD family protein [Streptomyces sp. H27-H5]MCY0961357.1 CsbD family protein [Streptomyces sp. H27-H5]
MFGEGHSGHKGLCKTWLKETAGRLTGNERLTAEGRAEQAKGDAREAKEKIKDTFKH